MRQAITTKFFGPTDSKGSRVKATAQAGSVYSDWDHAIGVEENHDRAAAKLANKFEWLANGWSMIGGCLPDGRGNVYVFIPPEAR